MSLTLREQQVCDLLLDGCVQAEIAARMGITRRVVKYSFQRLYLKFGIVSGVKRVKLIVLLYRRKNAC